MNNLYTEFTRRFPADPGRVLLETAQGERYSYADAAAASARLARFLSELGLERGDRVSVQVHKSPTVVWLYLACLRGGFVFHPLNPGYTAAEVEYFLSDAAPALVVADPGLFEFMAPLTERLGIHHVYSLDADGQGTLPEASRATPADHAVVDVANDNLAALLYSSGTTGQPKGIMLTHGNLIANGRALVSGWGFTADDVLLHALPIFHVHGLFIALHCVLLSGAAMQFLPRFEPAAVIATLPRSTVMMGVPTYYSRLLAQPAFDRRCCAEMRLFTCGSAPLHEDTFHAFTQRSGHVILERYGMTETSISASNPLDGKRKAGAVGFPIDSVELRVVDKQGKTLETGEIGRIQVRGPSVFAGYWRKPDKTREDFTPDGFFDTGDQGVLDEEGYLAIVGRAKDLIISGGLNVYPKEIEQVIDDLPSVQESAVVGVPHVDFGEAVVGILILKQGESLDEAALREQLKQVLAAYKVPKRLIAVEELPRNTLGKVQKNILRERYADLLAAG